MTGAERKMKPWLKKLLTTGLVLLVIGGGIVWYIFAEKFEDTKEVKADFTTNAADFLQEFQKDHTLANTKYSNKIIVVNGRVSTKEVATDSTINIKMIDTTTNNYLIFTFQEQHIKEAEGLKEGDSVSIKGACGSGVYSEILETVNVSFTRCAINKK